MTSDPEPNHWGEVSSAFDALVDASTEARVAALRALGARSAALGADVASLLAAHDAADGRFDQPAVASLPPMWQAVLALPEPLTMHTRIGAYLVQSKVGEGGMGSVYEAIRADDAYQQRVAIKTIARGAESTVIASRFRRERQILAQLEHPNIARLLDGGVTDAGIPYFVMEFVDGAPIDEWCALHRCTVAQRLDLLQQVCEAVQHAHRHLVVHRDLKPANVLVTADGTVKLLDFGIARLVDTAPGDGAASTSVTNDRATPMTVAYASPEQLRGEPVSTASDVYSLGVLLYELLAGVPPVPREGRSAVELSEAVLSTDPAPPSARCSASTAQAAGFADRLRLSRALSGDLDAIVMKAMHKDIARRYDSVDAVKEDLWRYRRGQPVLAKPDTFTYRSRKFVVRNRTGIAVALSFMVMATVAGMLVARQSLATRREYARSTRIANFLQGVLGAANAATIDGDVPQLGPGASLSALLDAAARRVPTQFADDPAIRARLYLTIGESLIAESRLHEAARLLDSSMVLARAAYGDQGETFVKAVLAAGTAALHRNRVTLADSLVRQAILALRDAGREDSDLYTRALTDRVLTTIFLGYAAQAQSDAHDALRLEQARTASPTLTKAVLLNRLGSVASAAELPVRADSLFRRSIAMLLELRASHNLEMTDVLRNAVSLHRALGHHAIADSMMNNGMRWAHETFGDNSREMALWLSARGDADLARGDTSAAIAAQSRAVRIVDSLPDVVSAVRMTIHFSPAMLAIARRRWPLADSLLRRVVADATTVPHYLPLAQALVIHASVLTNRGQSLAADSALSRAVAIYEANGLAAPYLRATMHTEQARSYAFRGDSAGVERELAGLSPSQATAVRSYLAAEARFRSRKSDEGTAHDATSTFKNSRPNRRLRATPSAARPHATRA